MPGLILFLFPRIILLLQEKEMSLVILTTQMTQTVFQPT